VTAHANEKRNAQRRTKKIGAKTTVEEARKLLEEGCEYVLEKDDIMLFGKRK
jgi:hypothetical protein